MAEYIPSPADWVREQVELYEGSGGAAGTTLRDTGLPCIIVTNRGNKTGAIRKTPLMRVKDGDNYVLVASKGGAATNPEWVYNLRADGDVEIRDETEVYSMRVREVKDACGTREALGAGGRCLPALRRVQEPDGTADSRLRCGAVVASFIGRAALVRVLEAL